MNQQIRVGSVLRRRSDGKKFRVTGVKRVEANMHKPVTPAGEFRLDNPDDQFEEIAKLERLVEKLELDLAATIRKVTSSEPDDDDDDEDTSFDERCREIRKRDGCSPLLAMAQARKEYPDEFHAYQKSAAPEAPRPRPGRRAQSAFEQEVARLASERKISKTAATSACRKERPDLFDALQRGE